MSNLKSKKTKRNKGQSKVKHRTKSKSHSRTKTRTLSAPTRSEAPLAPVNLTSSSVKTCQEVEIGDIGGFGSTQELEEHEKRCNEPATEFCTNCGKNVCRNHYDLIHRDHDTSGHASSQTPA